MNIITKNSQGLINDALILKKSLMMMSFQAYLQKKDPSSLNPKKRYPLIYQKAMHFLGSPIIKYNFHIEDIHVNWMRQAQKNIWIPNLEFMNPNSLDNASTVNVIMCKAKTTYSTLSKNYDNCKYIGFTSLDRLDQSVTKDYTKYLHLMGKSPLKGTRALVELWSCNPSWPTLIIVANRTAYNNIDWLDKIDCKNISIIYGPLPEKDIVYLQNYCGIHLCPSEVEGFGHYIVEALSTASIVLTTNAAPMNEHIDESFGFLVEYNDTQIKDMGTRYFVDINHLENQLQRIIAMPHERLVELGNLSRVRYEKITRDFSQKFRCLIFEP